MKAVPLDPELKASVLQAMAADGGHNVPEVSHALIASSGELWGAFSVAYAPCLFFWMDARKSNAIGSLRAIRCAVRVFKDLGHARILLPIQADSPFYPFVGSIGFNPIGSCELFETKL